MCRGKKRCLPCQRAARLGKMNYSRKLKGKSISINFYNLLWIVAGAFANYAIVNPLANKVIEQIGEGNLSKLGPYRGAILSATKGVGAGMAAFTGRGLSKEVKLALLGVASASGIEVVSQVMPDRMIALSGTGDLYINGIGNTEILNLPINAQGALNGVDTDSIAVFGNVKENQMATFGTGDLYASNGETMPAL